MKPKPDDPSEIEPPMTRALFATDADEELARSFAEDDVGNTERDTRRLASETDIELSRLANSGLAHGSSAGLGSPSLLGSGSAWSSAGGLGRRGIVGKIEPGQLLYSKYMVLKKLGAGAMGEVWLVRHVTLKSEHALKVIIPNFASNPVALMRFQRELEVMATLRQEHAVQIYDACLDEDGGYIDMEYLDGQTIHEILTAARARPNLDPSQPLMPLDWIARILDQICEVLQVAHAKGIVHRDLKPSNIMLLNGRKPGKESLKVLDFGIAKIRDDPESAAGRDHEDQANKTQGFIGTPSYASPEQALASENVDGRADLYSLGIMLYEFVTGRLPFRGNHWQVMSQNATTPPPSFAEANPKLRPVPELEHAILRVLAKDSNQRPSTALELFEEIREAIEAVLPPGSPGLTPPTWDTGSFVQPSSISHPTLFPTEHDTQSAAQMVSSQAATLVSATHPTDLRKPDRESPSDLGLVIPGRRLKLWPAALLVGLLLASAAVVRLFAVPRRSGSGTVSGSGSGAERISRSPTFEQYWSSSYLAVEGQDKLYPDKVRRTTDEVFFLKFADGIYLPEGYEIENRADLVDGWPKVITREGVRFLRIQWDNEWIMGDWDAPPGAERADAPPHAVIVSSFYIQETEVTNGQLEDYIKNTKSTPPNDWKANFIKLKQKVGSEDARRHPAVLISRKMAQFYANYMDGQLPTEAQWEFAARSRGQKRRYVWGNSPAPNREKANIDSWDSKTTAPVRSYEVDKTLQGVYDMTGNVQEICRDAWGPYKKTLLPERDPCALPADPDTAEYSIRGSCFNTISADCAITRRDDHMSLNDKVENIGFRLVIECPDTRKPR